MRAHPTPNPEATLAAVAAATALCLIIFTTPLTTLSPTVAALGAGPSAQAWLLSAMPLGAATGLLGAGALGDNNGRRPVFLGGLLVMAAASAVAALAPSALVLVLARLGQGLGAAAVMACGMGLIGAAFPDPRGLTRASAIWGAALGAGVAAGPILASAATGLAGWRAAYWCTAILAAALLALGRAMLPQGGRAQPRRLDWAGMLLLMVGLGLFMAALTEMRMGWARPVVLVLAGAGLACLAAFAWAESRHPDPVLAPRLFRNPGFVAATAAAFASGAGVLALMTLVPTVMIQAMGRSALAAALTLCAWSATSVVTSFAARWLPAALTPRLLLIGGLAGCAAAQLMLLGFSPATPVWQLLPGLFLAGAANGVLNAALGRQSVATVPPDQAAMGSGANNTARYLGSAIGITLGAVLLAHGAETGGTAGLLGGWRLAVAITAAFSLLGAGCVILLDRGAPETPKPEQTP